MKLLKEKH